MTYWPQEGKDWLVSWITKVLTQKSTCALIVKPTNFNAYIKKNAIQKQKSNACKICHMKTFINDFHLTSIYCRKTTNNCWDMKILKENKSKNSIKIKARNTITISALKCIVDFLWTAKQYAILNMCFRPYPMFICWWCIINTVN